MMKNYGNYKGQKVEIKSQDIFRLPVMVIMLSFSHLL